MAAPLFLREVPSPLGILTLAGDDQTLRGLWLAGQRYFGGPFRLQDCPPGDTPPLQAAVRWLEHYFAGHRPDPHTLPLAPEGTPFQQRVWAALLEIPYGATVTYGDLAARLGSAPRAVGTAVGRNPLSILIPCHRVVGAGGALTGYAGGVERKRWLLEFERTPAKSSPLPDRQ